MSGPRFPDAPGRDIPTDVRTAVMANDGRICQFCGEVATSIDHVYPWVQGGDHQIRNLVAAGAVCNSIAGQRVFVTGFTQKREYVLERRDKLGYVRLSRLYALASAGRKIERYV